MPNEVNITLSASETRLINGLRKGETAIKNYGQKTMEVFRRTGAAINHVSDRYLTRFNSLLGGAALAYAGKAVIDFDSKLARLSIVAGLSKQQMMGLKAQLFEVAAATSQAPTDLLEGVNAIVERTGDFKFAIDSLKDMGIVASATGANMADIGATASNLQEKMGITQDQVMTVFDVLNEQGKQGAFTLQNMASQFERLLSAGARMDVTGVEGMRTFGAFLQIARRGTGSAEEATTAVESSFASILTKSKELQASGIQLIDPVKTKKNGRETFRDFDKILKDIIVKSKGSTLILSEIFEQRAIRGITPLVQSWKKFGDFREMDEFAKMGGSGATTLKDFAFWSETTAAKLGDFRTQLSKFANENFAGPIELLNKALSFLNSHPALTKGGLSGLLGFGVLLGGMRILRGMRDIFGGGRGPAGIAGGLGGLGGAPMPVYVVNRHLSMLPGKGWGFPGGGAGVPGGAGGGGGIGRVLNSKAFLVAGAAAAGWTIGTLLNNEIDKAFGKKGGLGNWFYDITHRGEADRNAQQDVLWGKYYEAKKTGDRDSMKSLLNQIQLVVNIDRGGRVTTESSDMNTYLSAMSRGNTRIGD